MRAATITETDPGPSRTWLVITISFCSLLGVIPLDQALDRVGMPGAIGVAFHWQMTAMFVWFLAARPIARRWSLADRESGALGGLVLLALVATAVQAWLVLAIIRPASPYPPLISGIEVALGVLPVTSLMVCLISLVGSWTSARRQRARAADREAMLAASVVSAQLDALRTRLQPHFLLNALNTVVGLARLNQAERAADVAVDLGELLRFALAESGDDVPFDAEREIVERYLAIEQARLGDRLVVRWDVHPGMRTTRLPALLWQPLVENAIRHGIARRSTPGMLTLSARHDGAVLRLIIDADGPDGDVQSREEASTAAELGGLGLGMSTVSRRLQLLHGDRAGVTLALRDGGSRTELVMPIARTVPRA